MSDSIKKKLIIFDVDGTVWDSEKDVFLAFGHVLREKEGIEINKEQFKELAGLSLEDMFGRYVPEQRKDLMPEYVRGYRKYYIDEEHYLDETELFPGAKDTIEYFKEQGMLMAVASGKEEDLVKKMVSHFKLEGFSFILGSGRGKYEHKPDPEMLLHIMNELGIEKDDAVIIGDSKADILAGQNAGIDTIAVTYGFDKPEDLKQLNPTYIIDDFSTLKEIIKKQ